jgi:hypothetical protein
MNKLLVLCLLLAGCMLGSCQCSDKPDIGPVEDPQAAAVVRSAVPLT